MKRKTFSLTHAAQAFLQSSNAQCEQLEPLARSCSYKRPQSIKKYRQQKRGKEKEKEKEQKEYLSSRKYSIYHNNILNTVASSCARKSVSSATSRISAIDLMAADDPHDQWSNPKANRSGRVGKINISDFVVFSFSSSLMTLPISYKKWRKKKLKAPAVVLLLNHILRTASIDHGNIR
jgi:hypothetical protein